MARLFDDAASENLKVASGIVSAEPITVACWFNSDADQDQFLIGGGHTIGVNYYGLRIDAGREIEAVVYDGDTDTKAKTIAVYTLNTWHHGCAVFASNGDCRIYLDGGNRVNNANAHDAITIDRTSIAVSSDSTPWGYYSGMVAEAAIWNAVLTDAEAAILAKGYSPLFVHPQNLVAYWPLIRDEDQDRVGGYDMTAFNAPSIAPHPPVIYPAPPHMAYVSAAVPPVGQPIQLRATAVPGMRQWQPRVGP